MWIARDYNGDLYLFNTKPKKYETRGQWLSSDGAFFVEDIARELNIQVNWEDEEPRELVLKPIKEEQP